MYAEAARPSARPRPAVLRRHHRRLRGARRAARARRGGRRRARTGRGAAPRARTRTRVMRAFAAAGDVRGDAALAARRAELARRAARGAAPARRALRLAPSQQSRVLGGHCPTRPPPPPPPPWRRFARLLRRLGAAVEAEVVMCEAEAKAAAGDAAGAPARESASKRRAAAAPRQGSARPVHAPIDSLFVKDIVGEGVRRQARVESGGAARSPRPSRTRRPERRKKGRLSARKRAFASAHGAAAEAAARESRGRGLDFSAENRRQPEHHAGARPDRQRVGIRVSGRG